MGAALASAGENGALARQQASPLLVDRGQLWRCDCGAPALAGGTQLPEIQGGARAPALAGGSEVPALRGGAKEAPLAGGVSGGAISGGTARPTATPAAPPAPGCGSCGLLDGFLGCLRPRPSVAAPDVEVDVPSPRCRLSAACGGFTVTGAGPDAYIVDGATMTSISGTGCYEP